MPSKLIARLISEALLPALLIVGGKIVSVYVLAQSFQLSWHLNPESLLPNFVFSDQAVTIFVNSYSNLIVYGLVMFGFMWGLARAYHFHDTHVSPALVLKLLAHNLTRLLGGTQELYQKSGVWLSYVWLVTLFIGFHVLVGLTYWWVFVLVVVLSLIATWYFIADVERELTGHETTH